jgi:hypothetical protein
MSDRLHRAGWSLGKSVFGSVWQVDGSNGKNRLLAAGASQASLSGIGVPGAKQIPPPLVSHR